MKGIYGHIAFGLGIMIIFAVMCSSVHIFEHDFQKNASGPKDTAVHLDQKINDGHPDCKICDFHFSISPAAQLAVFDSYIPFKETVYSLSLRQTVWTFPDVPFSLRAPPAYCS